MVDDNSVRPAATDALVDDTLADEQLKQLESEQAELQRTSAVTIEQNLEQLTALQAKIEEDRTRLEKQQRKPKGVPPDNVADVEQQRGLEVEINELRRRRDNARDANKRTEKRLLDVLEQVERFHHHLNSPANTPYPVKSARNRRTPAERLEQGMRILSANMRAGPAGSALRSVSRPSTASSRPSTAGGGGPHGGDSSSFGEGMPSVLSETGAALADRLQQEKEERELAAAEAKLAAATDKRDTYEFMAARLRREKQQFDPRFQAAYAELQREKKRVAQVRIMSTDAIQAHANAEQVRRSTERKVAARQQRERAALLEQQQTLLSTQQSVLHFEVSRMSRSQSAVKLEPPSSASLDGGLSASGRPGNAAWSDPSAGRLRSDAGGGGGLAAVEASMEELALSHSSASLKELPPEERALEERWLQQRRRLGVQEPIDLVLKALAQREGRASLDALEEQTEARLAELLEEGEALARRREKAAAATSLAAGRRLERLHDLVEAAEKELAKGTAALKASDESLGDARKGVAALDSFAATAHASLVGQGTAPPLHEYVRRGDPLEAESTGLPALMEAAVETILQAVKTAEALRGMREARDALEADVAAADATESHAGDKQAAAPAPSEGGAPSAPPSAVLPSSPSTLAPALMT